MSIEIDILNGNESWPTAEPLFDEVWPAHVLEKLPGATSNGLMPICAC